MRRRGRRFDVDREAGESLVGAGSRRGAEQHPDGAPQENSELEAQDDVSEQLGAELGSVRDGSEPGQESWEPGESSPSLQLVVNHLLDQSRAVERLEDLMSELLARDAERSALFDRLYDDLEEQRAQRRADTKVGLYRSLILVIDHLDDLCGGRASNDCELLLDVREQIVEALEVDGLRRIQPDPSRFDPLRQQVLGVVDDIDDHALWREVRPGFETDQRMLRPQQIELRAGTDEHDS